jgi:2-keto-4-pentenoate hydratase
LTWLANELNKHGNMLHAGDFVTTGACVPPMPVEAGDVMHVDFGVLGTVEAFFC